MRYLVIELFPSLAQATLVTDEEGKNKVFETYDEAEKEAKDCQKGFIIDLLA